MKLGANDTTAMGCKITEQILKICINYDNCASFSNFTKFLSQITAIVKSVFLCYGLTKDSGAFQPTGCLFLHNSYKNNQFELKF